MLPLVHKKIISEGSIDPFLELLFDRSIDHSIQRRNPMGIQPLARTGFSGVLPFSPVQLTLKRLSSFCRPVKNNSATLGKHYRALVENTSSNR
jgi:hypothetical protein